MNTSIATTKTVGTNAKTGEHVFQIGLTRHTGLVLTCFTTDYTFTGGYRSCLAELDRAQRHNRPALDANTAAGKALSREAARAFGHPSARPVDSPGVETRRPVAA